MRLHDAVEEFQKNLLALQRSKETIRSYLKDLRLFEIYLCRRYNCEVFVDDVEEDDIDEYLYYTLTERNYSPASRRRVVITMKSFFTFCEKKGYSHCNPAKAVEYAKLEQKERVYLTEDEVLALFEAANAPLLEMVIKTLYYTGLRVSECVNLRLQDMDITAGMLKVRAGKGSKDRSIPISKKLKPQLSDYLSKLRKNAGSDYFFTSKSGRICPSYINRKLKECSTAAGIEKHVTAHILRHSFASNMLKNGVDILRIQKLLGHSSIRTTSIYIHTNMEDLDEAVNVL